ncbi:MAG: PIH1 domain-containing protein 1, partial [Paramarteilia canceri]
MTAGWMEYKNLSAMNSLLDFERAGDKFNFLSDGLSNGSNVNQSDNKENSHLKDLVMPGDVSQKNQEQIFVSPDPGFCLKTLDKISGKKFFINFCQSTLLPSPTDLKDDQLLEILQNMDKTKLRIPLAIGESDNVKDVNNNECYKIDVLISNDGLNRMIKNPLWMSLIQSAGFESIEQKLDYKVNLCRETIIKLKRRFSIGNLQNFFIKRPDDSKLVEEICHLNIDEDKIEISEQNFFK